MAVQVETRKVKLSQIKLNPDNPRQISKADMASLIKSLQEFPEMLSLREIVVDENMMVLGGNMRLRALRKLKEKYCIAKIVKGLTPEQKREFVIKDNAAWGQWDFDVLANKFDDLPLIDWGVKGLESNDEIVRGVDEIPEIHEVIILNCDDEEEQREIFDFARSKGYPCRVLTL